jgi:hypothetical protein
MNPRELVADLHKHVLELPLLLTQAGSLSMEDADLESKKLLDSAQKLIQIAGSITTAAARNVSGQHPPKHPIHSLPDFLPLRFTEMSPCETGNLEQFSQTTGSESPGTYIQRSTIQTFVRPILTAYFFKINITVD